MSSYLERVNPDKVRYALWQEHINRYTFALGAVSGKVVLDVACGTGYGSKLISKTASLVVGVDISRKALIYATNHYRKNPNTEFVLADANNLPFRDSAFEIVVSFETIEHLARYGNFLQEIKYILKMSGRLIVSTPNGKIYSSSRQAKPRNPFHFKEFGSDEFSQVLSIFSPKMQFYGQCPYTLKDLLFQILDKHLPLSLKFLFSKLNKTISESSVLQMDMAKTIDPKYHVRKIWDLYPIYCPRFFIVVVKNEK